MDHDFNGNFFWKIFSLIDDVSLGLNRELFLAKRCRIERVKQLHGVGKSDDDPAHILIATAQSQPLNVASSEVGL
jgi:hypothetical protein